MKNKCTNEDYKIVRSTILDGVKIAAGNNRHNAILLSGGIDSSVVLFSAMELKLDYTVVNFRFKGVDSVDNNSVKRLQEKIGFEAKYLEIEHEDDNDIKEAIKICKKTFGKVRAVKVQTIYAMLQVKKHIEESNNILCGYGGDDLLGYSRNTALLASKKGEGSKEVLKKRLLAKDQDEFSAVFNRAGYYTPYTDESVQKLITRYTTRACNESFPKSILVRAFSDYFRKYKNARKPIGLHKGSCEAVLFEQIAKKKGFSSTVAWLNDLAKKVI